MAVSPGVHLFRTHVHALLKPYLQQVKLAMIPCCVLFRVQTSAHQGVIGTALEEPENGLSHPTIS
jgi:hypothetical protein